MMADLMLRYHVRRGNIISHVIAPSLLISSRDRCIYYSYRCSVYLYLFCTVQLHEKICMYVYIHASFNCSVPTVTIHKYILLMFYYTHIQSTLRLVLFVGINFSNFTN